MTDNSNGEACSFCLRSAAEVARLLGGETGARICDDCVGACGRILADPEIPFPGLAGDSDDHLLRRLSTARDLVDGATHGLENLVGLLRARDVSWARIGDELGISRQAAWERFR